MVYGERSFRWLTSRIFLGWAAFTAVTVVVAEPRLKGSCHAICQDKCTTTTLGRDLRKHFVGNVPEDIGEGVADYVGNVTDALIPGFLQRQSSHSRAFHNCEVECENEIADKCLNHFDSADAVNASHETFTNEAAMDHCADLVKLKYVVGSGNLRYSLKFGIPPPFGQLAGLRGSGGLLEAGDLDQVRECATGGDDASFDVGKAQSLFSCMISKTVEFAEVIKQNIIARQWNHTLIGKPGRNEDSIVPSNTNAITEDIFYVQDLRCFEGCPAIENLMGQATHPIAKRCLQHGDCHTDFGELLFATGAVTLPGGGLQELVGDVFEAGVIDDWERPSGDANEDPQVKRSLQNLKFLQKKRTKKYLAPGEDLTIHHADETNTTTSEKVHSEFVEGNQTIEEYAAWLREEYADVSAGEHAEEAIPNMFCKSLECPPFPALWNATQAVPEESEKCQIRAYKSLEAFNLQKKFKGFRERKKYFTKLVAAVERGKA